MSVPVVDVDTREREAGLLVRLGVFLAALLLVTTVIAGLTVDVGQPVDGYSSAALERSSDGGRNAAPSGSGLDGYAVHPRGP